MAKRAQNQDTTEEAATEVVTADLSRLQEVTSDTAETAEDMALLAYKGEAIPGGWSYNADRGFFRNEVEVQPDRPIDPVTPNLQGADAPSDPASGDGV